MISLFFLLFVYLKISAIRGKARGDKIQMLSNSRISTKNSEFDKIMSVLIKFSFTCHKMVNSTKFSRFCEIQQSWQKSDEFDKNLSMLSNSAFLVIKLWIA